MASVRTPAAAASAAVRLGSAGAGASAPSARLVPSCASASHATTRSPSASSGTSAPHVPTRIATSRPSSISSCTTIAALGPPMPVDWIVSGLPSAFAGPVYPHNPRLWLNIRGSSSSVWASASARPGSPGSSARGASCAVGWTWIGTRRAEDRVGGVGGPDSARRILITGVPNFWGTGLARALLADPDVERVVGVDTRTPPSEVPDAITLSDADLRTPQLRTSIRAAAVDTVVHSDIPQFPEPGRAARQLHDLTVVGTLQLLAAAGDLPTLRTLVVRGSAAIYGSEPAAPAFFTEDMAGASGARGATRFQRDLGEIEKLVGGLGRRRRDITCTVLRLQPIIGTRLDNPITRLLRAPVVPVMLGFDPRVQVLHEDDSVGVLHRAVHHPVAGAVNVAGPGAISLNAAIRRMGRPSIPVPHPLFGMVTGAATRFGLPPMSEDTVRYMRYGRGVATERMTTQLGFTPRYDTRAAVDAVAASLREEEAAAHPHVRFAATGGRP